MSAPKCRVSFGVCLNCGNSFTTKGARPANYCSPACWPRTQERSAQSVCEGARPTEYAPREHRPYQTRDGYRMVWNGAKYVREHRMIVEQSLHRKLRADEHVHHINHDKGDNALGNLIVVNPTTHALIHMAENQQGVEYDF
jgi:hypothetical protein